MAALPDATESAEMLEAEMIMNEESSGLEIAVIGMAGRFPGAADVAQLWDLLREGREGLAGLTAEQLASAGVPPDVAADPRYVAKRGSVSRKREFDAELFGYTAADAAIIDPQFGVFHEVAWEALEDAGYQPSKYDGRIGLFAGATGNLSWIHKVMQSSLTTADYYNLATLTESSYLCTRVAHRLDLTGPAMTINTTCSTSLVGIHQACQSLLIGDCDMALAGGVSIAALEDKGYTYQDGMVYSPDGSCRSFDAGANGTAAGEGSGVLVLKRLDDALAHGDRVLAVIKGSAINNDGRSKSSFMAPSSGGQAAVIAAALQRAGVDAASISYVETHGTGTKLGDPIEVAGLLKVFGDQAPGRCAIGSIKSNIGHLGEAAGAAGAIKVILSLQHRQLPPSLHFTAPNPYSALAGSALAVNTVLRDWPAQGGERRRAGVSSFGIGGTNAHVVFEEAPPQAPSGPGRSHNVAVLSANSLEALEAQTRSLAQRLRDEPSLALDDVCFTLHLGRADLAYRRAWTAQDSADLANRLENAASVRAEPADYDAELCMMFPGQGSQYAGMGRDLYESEAVFRAAVDECLASAARHGLPGLRAVLYPPAGTATSLTDTALVQPALFIHEYALAQLLQSWGYRARAYVGHSLGEYVAACLAGVFTLDDALAVVIERGRLVSQLPAGAMLAVTLGEAALGERLPPGVEIAAVNTPDRVVASGDIAAIEALAQALARDGIECVRLNTSHAFHSHHLDPVLERFERFLAGIPMQAPHTPVVSNVSGTWLTDAEAVSPQYWARQLRAPVRFADCIETLCQDAPQVLAEVGPGRALGGFALRHQAARHARRVVALAAGSSQHGKDSDLAVLLAGIGQLYCHGVKVDWRLFYAGQQRRRVALPTYPFAQRCYYPASLLAAAAATATDAVPATPDPAASGHAVAVPAPASNDLTPVQQQLSTIWTGFLGIEQLDIHVDLFNLGVDSLLSIRAISAIRDAFHVDITLDTIFLRRTIAEQAAEIEERLRGSDSETVPPIAARGLTAPAFLSASQERLWIISQLEDEHTAYNTGFFHFVKNIDIDLLERAFRAVIDRHSILRTTYAEVDGQPVQTAHDEYDFSIEHLDASALPIKERHARAKELWQQALMTPIDLARDLMIRVRMLRFDETTHIMMVAQHHICSDNWSTNVLMEEVNRVYEAFAKGEPDPRPPLALQYADYALWQRDWLASGMLERQLAYWTAHLADIPTVHNLPLDHPRPRQQSYKGRQYIVRVADGVLDGLQSLGQRRGATLFMTMQAAFSAFLGRYSGDTDVVTGFPVANRPHKELEEVIGFFVNTLVMRSNVSGEQTFSAFLERTRQTLLSAYANQYVPFQSLVDVLRPARSLSFEPIVQVMLVYLDQSETHGGRKVLRQLVDREEDLRNEMNVPFSKYDLSLYFSVHDDELELTWEYATDLFEQETIARMAENFATLLRGIVADPESPLAALPLASTPDLRRQLAFGNSAAAPVQPVVAAANEADAVHSAKHFAFSLFYFASDNGARAGDKYKLLMEGAQYADRNGFEAVWTPERHFDAFGGTYPNPAIAAAALASVTRNVHLRAGSCVLPLHNPVRVAEDWSVIDNISGGRVGIGFAAGYSARDFTLAPQNFEVRRDVLVDEIGKVKALWRGDTVFMPNGRGELGEIQIRPRPLQRELPVWVTTVGNEEAFRQAGRNGDYVLTHLMGQSLDELSAKIALYRAERAAAGYPGEGHVTMLAHTFVSANEQVIFDSVKEPFKKYLIDSVGTPQAISKSLGGGNEGRDHDIDAVTEFAFQRYYQSNALLGTAERCLPLVNAIRAAGVNEIACLIDFGVESQLVLDNLPNLNRLKDMALALPLAQDEPVAASMDQPDAGGLLHVLFEEQAARTPDALALYDHAARLTFAEANARANRLAHRLIGVGVAPDRRVAVLAERGIDAVVAMLAVLKAGGAYVPIDASWPQDRIALILEDAAPVASLVHAALAPRLPALNRPIVLLDNADELSEGLAANPDPRALGLAPAHLAYVRYGSGTTGKPKGVMTQHDAIANQIAWGRDHFKLGAQDRMLQTSPCAVDVSLFDTLVSLASGTPVMVAQSPAEDGADALTATIIGEGITAAHFTPTLLARFLAHPRAAHCVSLRVVMCSGEPLSHALYRRFARLLPDIGLYNLYGAAEVAVHAVASTCTPDPAQRCPIGTPIANVQCYVLDGQGQLAPHGVVGELHIGGVAVSRGYLNQPDLTEASFIADPFSTQPGRRLFRTGDLVRWLPDGTLDYVGPKDSQIKVRGQRMEIADIEKRLRDCDGVRDAVVMAHLDGGGAPYLEAYVLREAGMTLEPAGLRRQLIGSLPGYIVPDAYVILDAWPVNPAGKLDRDALAASARGSLATPVFEAPVGVREERLARIWQELLALPQVSRHDGFFDLGGNYKTSILLADAIAEQFGVAFDTRTVFETETVAGMAARIEALLFTRDNSAGIDAQTDDDVEIML